MQVIKSMTAANRITGSASMKIGIVPDVSVTMVDEKMIDNPTFFKQRRIPLGYWIVKAL